MTTTHTHYLVGEGSPLIEKVRKFNADRDAQMAARTDAISRIDGAKGYVSYDGGGIGGIEFDDGRKPDGWVNVTGAPRHYLPGKRQHPELRKELDGLTAYGARHFTHTVLGIEGLIMDGLTMCNARPHMMPGGQIVVAIPYVAVESGQFVPDEHLRELTVSEFRAMERAKVPAATASF